jgi:Flp pilus assembly protein TadG
MHSLFSKDSEVILRNGRKRSCLRGEEGAELVEFALSTSILFLFVFGLIEICLVFFLYNTAAEAAREGSRWASVRGTDCTNPNSTNCPLSATPATDIATYVNSLPGAGNMAVAVQWCVPPTGGSCTATTGTWGAANLGAGNTVQVKVSYTLAKVPFVTNSSLKVSSTSQSVIW